MTSLSVRNGIFWVLLSVWVSSGIPVSGAEKKDKGFVLERSQVTTGRHDRPVRPVKNIIVLIPDGCSLATVSAARWYQWLQHPDRPSLYLDPFVCGTVRTFSSNAPIGDSAPTTSCYMTGEPSRTGFVATYPPASGDADIFTVDPKEAYQPLMTLPEAARIVQGRSTGLVFTCEFPHATPADCSSHDYNRNSYDNIAEQMVHNRFDFVAGGGCSYLRPEWADFLRSGGYTVQMNDAKGLRTFHGKKLWSLFGAKAMAYDLDRDSLKEPSLSEMTGKAIQTLSQNSKGFFLMVEGSKVDWAAHANDPVGMVTELLAFDEACKVALDFARRDRNTAVLILPDHGNSGISLGSTRLPGYDKLTKDQLFAEFLKNRKTADGLAALIAETPLMAAKDTLIKYTGFVPSDEELSWLNLASDYRFSPIPAPNRRQGPSLFYTVAKILAQHSPFGFTTNGHTGEEVFLASYHPKGDILQGVRFNVEVNDYLCSLFGLEHQLPGLTKNYFARHQDVFADCTCTLVPGVGSQKARLTVRKGNKVLELKQNSNEVVLNGTVRTVPSVVVYVDINRTFYLPASLAEWLK
jgi:alkaline phosphatase